MQKIIISSAFFAVVYFIYGFMRPEWCNFHEQYQMFLFGWDYLSDHLSIPSGTADYLAEFVVQFFFFPEAGAALWAAMLTGLGLLMCVFANKIHIHSEPLFYPLLFVVPALVVACCGDKDVMPSYVVALLLALAAASGYASVSTRNRIWLQCVLVPIVYWLCGGIVVVYILLTALADSRHFGISAGRLFCQAVACGLLYVFTALVSARTVMCQYPFSDAFMGHVFYRQRLVEPVFIHVISISVFLLLLILRFLPVLSRWFRYASVALVFSIVLAGNAFCYQYNEWEGIYVDYLVRHQRWDDVVAYFENRKSENLTSCTGINLSLAMTGQLAERQFDFSQYKQDGLIQPFGRNMFSCVITGEAFYYMGMLGQSLRMYYDSQESILNYKKSARLSSRIAECMLLDGRYDMATTYARMLGRTLFYRQMGSQIEQAAIHNELISSNPQWARILEYRLPDNLFYYDAVLSDFLMELYQHSHNNTLALQYSLAVDLANFNMDSFLQNFPYTQGGRDTGFQNVPRVYQEALAYVYLQRTGQLQQMPPFISPEVQRRLSAFMQYLQVNRDAPEIHSGQLSKSFWHYIYFGNN